MFQSSIYYLGSVLIPGIYYEIAMLHTACIVGATRRRAFMADWKTAAVKTVFTTKIQFELGVWCWVTFFSLFTDLNATFAVNDDYKFKFLPVRGTIIAETGLKCSALQHYVNYVTLCKN